MTASTITALQPATAADLDVVEGGVLPGGCVRLDILTVIAILLGGGRPML